VGMDGTGLLDEVRALLRDRDSRSDVVVAPSSYSQPVAFLTTADNDNSRYVLLLNEGINEVGRSCPAYSESRRALTGVIEGWQWRIECCGRDARAQDTRSTDGSVVLRRGTILTSVAERRTGVGVSIGWDGSRSNESAVPLNEGDMIINQYRAFIFGWVR
jgi:hypothetical protein